MHIGVYGMIPFVFFRKGIMCTKPSSDGFFETAGWWSDSSSTTLRYDFKFYRLHMLFSSFKTLVK